jgi:hypothetical protein
MVWAVPVGNKAPGEDGTASAGAVLRLIANDRSFRALWRYRRAGDITAEILNAVVAEAGTGGGNFIENVW